MTGRTGKVLVACGTTNGSTAQTAEAIAEVLRKAGLTVEVLPARSVTSLSPYDAVVVGGGLYAGRRHRDTPSFVRRHGTRTDTSPSAVASKKVRRGGWPQ